MKLSIDFSALHSAVAPLNYVIDDFVIRSGANALESVAKGLSIGKLLGEDIPLEEIDGSQGILNYNGHQVMLYIADQGPRIEQVIESGSAGTKVHIAECSTLEQMRNTGRFGRYHVISRMDGWFPVYGIDPFSSEAEEGKPTFLCVKIA